MRNVALDLGSRISFCELNGEEVIRATGSLEGLATQLGPGTPRARVAIEACGEAWHVMDQLRSWGHDPVLVDTTRVRQLGIGHHKRKNDRIDAETLARALAEERLPKAHELSKNGQQVRRAVNTRALLVGMRAKLITAIRAEARSMGRRLPSCGTEAFDQNLKNWLLSPELKERIAPLREVLATTGEALLKAEAQLEGVSKVEPAIQLLQSAPGVGPVLAASFVSVIDDPKRFKTAHQVEAYLGLVPSENTSITRRLGHITKQGNSYLRSVLVQGAWSILRSRESSSVKTWAKTVVTRRGKRVAAVALARRMAGILWAMWLRNQPFDPRYRTPGEKQALSQKTGPKLGKSATRTMNAPTPRV